PLYNQPDAGNVIGDIHLYVLNIPCAAPSALFAYQVAIACNDIKACHCCREYIIIVPFSFNHISLLWVVTGPTLSSPVYLMERLYRRDSVLRASFVKTGCTTR
ncbi:hypothetical protein L9F63_016473, partial [Diploptera punctata]